jgi:LysM repeat protein
MRLAVATVALAGLRIAHAQEATPDTLTLRARQGDTLELVAAEHYGDRSKAMFIVAANKLGRARPLKPGERLRIPVLREVAASPGDTFESMAATYLGSARRGTFLAEFNNVAVEESLPAGTVISIPFAVLHTAASPESLPEISRMYYGDARTAELLRRYNFLDKAVLDRGESLLIPSVRFRVGVGKSMTMDAESKLRAERRRSAAARVARALPAAREAWKAGDFAAATAALAPLEPELDFLDSNDAVDVGVLLGAAYLAHDATDKAVAVFRRVIDRQARHVLRRYAYSPRIIAAWQQAGGQVE